MAIAANKLMERNQSKRTIIKGNPNKDCYNTITDFLGGLLYIFLERQRNLFVSETENECAVFSLCTSSEHPCIFILSPNTVSSRMDITTACDQSEAISLKEIQVVGFYE